MDLLHVESCENDKDFIWINIYMVTYGYYIKLMRLMEVYVEQQTDNK